MSHPPLHLTDHWQVHHQELTASRPSATGPAWPCALPMDARSLLAQVGEVPDPRFGTQSKASDWVAARSWWFVHDLPPGEPAARRFLHLRGLDSDASIHVDGAEVARVPSASEEVWLEVPDEARQLAIGLRPLPADELEYSDGQPRWRPKRAPVKPVIFAGGDHNPFLANAGMNEAPQLHTLHAACLTGVRLEWQDAGEGLVDATVVVEARCWQATTLTITLQPECAGGEVARTSLALAPGAGERRCAWPGLRVQRWWPRQFGEPRCYTLTVASAEQTVRRLVGFRSVERRRCANFLATPAPSVFAWHPYENNAIYGQEFYKGYDAIREGGESWPERPREGSWDIEVHVNGRAVWIAGGAVLPPTLFWADWSPERQVALVERAVEAGLNTLRVWGGGMLLDDAFYEACDRAGLMVHHDYLNFAGTFGRSWSEQRRQEAFCTAVARRLANHPSVISMNGGNELLQLAERRPEDPLQQIMRRVTTRELPQVLYHASCPVNPEVHGPWLYNLDHAARYDSQRTPLNSECGIMAVPALPTLTRMLGGAELAEVFGPAWLHRMADPGYFSTLTANAALFAEPRSLSVRQAIDCTQYVQALGYQQLAEAYRRQRPASTGVIIWEFSEPWGDLNWGLISHDGVAKDALPAMARALRPVHASLRILSPVAAAGSELAVGIAVHADGGTPNRIELEIQAVTADGVVLGRQRFNGAGTWSVRTPQPGPVCVALRGTIDGTPVDTEQWVCVLPSVPRPQRPRVLVVSGGSFEDHLTLAFLAAAGLDCTVVAAEPGAPLTGPDPADFAAVVLAPIFDPVASLDAGWLARLRSAVTAGRTGLAYFAYNTTAYLAGRYAVQPPQGSDLEGLLPLAFAADCYGNSHDPRPDVRLARSCAHPVWSGIDFAGSPHLGFPVRMTAATGATVLGHAGDAPGLAIGQLGAGRTLATVIPWGGHNFMNVGYRGWLPGQRLIANLVEWVATGAVVERPTVERPFAPLLALPRARLSQTITAVEPGRWRVEVRNTAAAPLFQFRVGCTSLEEGRLFDWHVQGDSATGTLLAGETRTWTCHATPIAGAALPTGLAPDVTAWNLDT